MVTKNIKSPKAMKKIDPIAYAHWKKCVRPALGRSITKTKEFLHLIRSGGSMNPWKSTSPIIRKIYKSGQGMNTIHHSMITFQYLAAVCSYHLLMLQGQKARKARARKVR